MENTKTIQFKQDDILKIAGMLSDIQEFADKTTRGKINLIKGFLFGRKEIVDYNDELETFGFKSKYAYSRFCDKCGLLRVGEYAECECTEGGD